MKVFKSGARDALSISSFILNYIHDFRNAMVRKKIQTGPRPNKWEVPLEYYVANIGAVGIGEPALIAQRFSNMGVILEGDDASVIKTLREDEKELSTFGNLLDEVKSLVKRVSNLELNWVNRQSNMVEHTLAQLAKVQSLGN
ncbi:hypothetical protein ACH5RR_017993 [Cinchona calisaya]|uniref:RNase H type-1 domain-containing protein n=1 Tax=Cinchona calisaya TaxID=153742 RepID=A0ABD2ZL41_9GENT